MEDRLLHVHLFHWYGLFHWYIRYQIRYFLWYQRKRMSTVQIMVEMGACFRTIDDALRRFDRRQTSAVLNAYATIMSQERRELKTDITPAHHASWIHKLSRGVGIVVVPITCVVTLTNQMQVLGVCAWSDDDPIPIASFDPRAHAILCVDATVVSYMENNPDYILGQNANVVTSSFKTSLVWWTMSE
jgi:hypothetical protein